LVLFVATLVLAACGGAAAPTVASDAGAPSGGGASVGASTEPTIVPGASEALPDPGANGYEGTLTSSGQYAATWSVAPDMPAGPFNGLNNPSLTSDKGTFGNIKVMPDGAVSFGSAASELTNGSYDGTGATVTLDSSGQFVCAFTMDTDLKGSSDGIILHMAGGMTVHWSLLEGGDRTCP
jgi:hypothetical protein